jgi:uncharacterized protein YciI
MLTGTPPTEFKFSPLLISPLVTLVTEKLDKKDRMMLEQQARIQAKTAAEPRKSSDAGPYVDGDTSNRVQNFSVVDIIPGDTCHRKAGQKKTARCLSNRRESKPKTQPSHENPAMRVRMLTGTPPTEYKFSPLLIPPPMTLVTKKLDKKDRLILEQQAGIQAETAAEPQKSSNAGPYVNGDTSNRVRVFAAVDLTPGVTRHRMAGRKGPLDA